MKTCTLVFQEATAEEFVNFWSALYDYKNEKKYEENIGKRLTAEGIRDLFYWKNGGPLSSLKSRSVENNFIDNLSELERIPQTTTGHDFLSKFHSGGAIWRIFWLHCWQPNRFPIYDQHVHRAMIFIVSGTLEEISKDDRRKIQFYFEKYIPFFDGYSNLNSRTVDRALWAFGKFLKTNKSLLKEYREND